MARPPLDHRSGSNKRCYLCHEREARLRAKMWHKWPSFLYGALLGQHSALAFTFFALSLFLATDSTGREEKQNENQNEQTSHVNQLVVALEVVKSSDKSKLSKIAFILARLLPSFEPELDLNLRFDLRKLCLNIRPTLHIPTFAGTLQTKLAEANRLEALVGSVLHSSSSSPVLFLYKRQHNEKHTTTMTNEPSSATINLVEEAAEIFCRGRQVRLSWEFFWLIRQEESVEEEESWLAWTFI